MKVSTQNNLARPGNSSVVRWSTKPQRRLRRRCPRSIRGRRKAKSDGIRTIRLVGPFSRCHRERQSSSSSMLPEGPIQDFLDCPSTKRLPQHLTRHDVEFQMIPHTLSETDVQRTLDACWQGPQQQQAASTISSPPIHFRARGKNDKKVIVACGAEGSTLAKALCKVKIIEVSGGQLSFSARGPAHSAEIIAIEFVFQQDAQRESAIHLPDTDLIRAPKTVAANYGGTLLGAWRQVRVVDGRETPLLSIFACLKISLEHQLDLPGYLIPPMPKPVAKLEYAGRRSFCGHCKNNSLHTRNLSPSLSCEHCSSRTHMSAQCLQRRIVEKRAEVEAVDGDVEIFGLRGRLSSFSSYRLSNSRICLFKHRNIQNSDHLDLRLYFLVYYQSSQSTFIFLYAYAGTLNHPDHQLPLCSLSLCGQLRD